MCLCLKQLYEFFMGLSTFVSGSLPCLPAGAGSAGPSPRCLSCNWPDVGPVMYGSWIELVVWWRWRSWPMTITAFIFWRISSAGQPIHTKWQERSYPHTHKLPWMDICHAGQAALHNIHVGGSGVGTPVVIRMRFVPRTCFEGWRASSWRWVATSAALQKGAQCRSACPNLVMDRVQTSSTSCQLISAYCFLVQNW